jgi:hypothetical protein
MEKVGNSENELSLFEFQTKFTNERDSLEHLSHIKWKDGFKCKKCNHTIYCNGVNEFDGQCSG